VTIVVSRGTVTVDGQKMCSRCPRPRDQKNQRLCRACHAQDMRDRRAGKVEVLLTPEEWGLILERRRAGPASDPVAPAGPGTAPGPQAAAGQPVPARSPESSGGLG
jgi:hypothetical protein